jgi:hypothetical protein
MFKPSPSFLLSAKVLDRLRTHAKGASVSTRGQPEDDDRNRMSPPSDSETDDANPSPNVLEAKRDWPAPSDQMSAARQFLRDW